MELVYGSSCVGRRPMLRHKVGNPQKKSESFMYAMVQLAENQYVFAGSLSWRIFLPVFTLEDNAFVIRSDGEGKQLAPGQSSQYEQVVMTRSTDWLELLDTFGNAIAKENGIGKLKDVEYKGWATWDYYGRIFTKEDVFGNMDELNKLDPDCNMIQIDGGWWTERGDYTSIRDGLDGGIKALADRIAAEGKTPGLHFDGFRGDAAAEICKTHPEYFLEKNPESAFVNSDNPYVLSDHLKCAVFELPFREDEGFPGPVSEHLRLLEESGVVRLTSGSYHWADQSYPAEQVSLRSAMSDNVVIVDTTEDGSNVIGEMDRPSAKEMLFTNAVYIHRGNQYIVTDLDIDNRRCYVKQSDVDYFTDALVKRDVRVLIEDSRHEYEGTQLVTGDVLVRSVVAKFKKIRFTTHENVGYGPIELPEEQMHTRSAILLFPAESRGAYALETLESTARPVVLGRLARLFRSVAPAFLMAGSSDLGVHSSVRDPHFDVPAIYLYDRYPGGSGLSEAFSTDIDRILSAARERVHSCPCESGCPSCVGPIDSGEGFDGNPKTALLTFLDAWIPRAQAP